MSWVHALLALVVAQRLAEMALARANTRRLLALGGIEAGAGHYPLFVVLHGAWIATMTFAVPPDTSPRPEPLCLLGGLMLARVWVLASLGEWWTTRIVTVPGAPLTHRGPYRFIRHPNYLVVSFEIATVPLIFDAWEIAVAFSVLNGLLLAHRIAVEDDALTSRRSATIPVGSSEEYRSPR